MKLRTLVTSLTLLLITVGLCQADLSWTGAADTDAFNEANWSLDGGGAPAAGTVDPMVPILQDVTVTDGSIQLTGGGFGQFAMGDGYSLTLDNSVLTKTGTEGFGGSNDVANLPSYFNLNNGTDATIQFASVGSIVNVDSTSTLVITGGGDGINSQSETTQVHLSLGAQLTLPTVAEFTEQGNEIFVNGVSFNTDNSILSFSGSTATAVPEPATIGLIAMFGAGLFVARRKLKV